MGATKKYPVNASGVRDGLRDGDMLASSRHNLVYFYKHILVKYFTVFSIRYYHWVSLQIYYFIIYLSIYYLF